MKRILASVLFLFLLNLSTNAQQFRVMYHGISAPEMQSFEVKNGEAYLNGKQMKKSDLPSNLDLKGVEVQYVYSSGVVPVIEINDKLYTIEGSKLLYMVRRIRNEADFGSFLDEQTDKYPQVEPNILPLENTRQLYEIKNDAPQLYQQIRREQWLELQSQQLAVKIRMEPQQIQRTQMINELRTTLETIFDLRMENQRAEIRHMELQLNTMKTRLREKELQKSRIVQDRLQKLLEN